MKIHSIFELISVFLAKTRRKLFIPHGLTRNPKAPQSVISDLFFIRSGDDWRTDFELLNISALLLGGFEKRVWGSAIMYFFSSCGEVIQKLEIPIDSTPRSTINIDYLTRNLSKVPATFALFHSESETSEMRGASLITERGYIGYEYKNLGAKSYVHGNLDAVALSSCGLEPLGLSGKLTRLYTVQHLLTGDAKYEFAFTNPTSKAQKIVLEQSSEGGKWRKSQELILESLGAGILEVDNFQLNQSLIRFRSKLYLGRPVVFRTTSNSMDVFHG
jgi:hypothetical protein